LLIEEQNSSGSCTMTDCQDSSSTLLCCCHRSSSCHHWIRHVLPAQLGWLCLEANMCHAKMAAAPCTLARTATAHCCVPVNSRWHMQCLQVAGAPGLLGDQVPHSEL
jgi:hypothetical protein